MVSLFSSAIVTTGLQVVARFESLPGDGARFVGGEIDEDLGDVLRARERRRILVRIGVGAHIGAGGAGVDAVHAHRRRPELGGEDLGEALEAELRDGVGSPVRLAAAAHARAHVDDRALAPSDELGDERSRDVEETGCVDAEYLVPRLCVELHERSPPPEDAGVVDEDGEIGKPLHRGPGEALALLRVGHVRREKAHRAGSARPGLELLRRSSEIALAPGA